MGLGKGKSCFVFFLEYFLLALCGCGLGSLCGWSGTAGGGRQSLMVAAIFLGCCLPGIAAALVSMGRGSVMQILTQKGVEVSVW